VALDRRREVVGGLALFVGELVACQVAGGVEDAALVRILAAEVPGEEPDRAVDFEVGDFKVAAWVGVQGLLGALMPSGQQTGHDASY
jgi:hypothetical protein